EPEPEPESESESSNETTRRRSSQSRTNWSRVEPGDVDNGAFRFGCSRQRGNFLSSLYIAVKLCYLINIIGQLYLMQVFLGTEYDSSSYGLLVLIDLLRGRQWRQSGHFPRVTFCDLESKKLGNNHIQLLFLLKTVLATQLFLKCLFLHLQLLPLLSFTMQCVLPLNMFLEKIYIFLWFWHCTIGLITLVSLFAWLRRMYWPDSRVLFVRKYLSLLGPPRFPSRLFEWSATSTFTDAYLTVDGVFLIRLISINCGELLAGDLVCELWTAYSLRLFGLSPKVISCPHCSLQSASPTRIGPLALRRGTTTCRSDAELVARQRLMTTTWPTYSPHMMMMMMPTSVGHPPACCQPRLSCRQPADMPLPWTQDRSEAGGLVQWDRLTGQSVLSVCPTSRPTIQPHFSTNLEHRPPPPPPPPPPP
ncbi:unnamed protein product, partial [Protopolystoma xenopodis]